MALPHARHGLDEDLHALVGVQPADVEDHREACASLAMRTAHRGCRAEADHVDPVGHDPDRHLQALAPCKVRCGVARAGHGVELAVHADEILPQLTAHPPPGRPHLQKDSGGVGQHVLGHEVVRPDDRNGLPPGRPGQRAAEDEMVLDMDHVGKECAQQGLRASPCEQRAALSRIGCRHRPGPVGHERPLAFHEGAPRGGRRDHGHLVATSGEAEGQPPRRHGSAVHGGRVGLTHDHDTHDVSCRSGDGGWGHSRRAQEGEGRERLETERDVPAPHRQVLALVERHAPQRNLDAQTSEARSPHGRTTRQGSRMRPAAPELVDPEEGNNAGDEEGQRPDAGKPRFCRAHATMGQEDPFAAPVQERSTFTSAVRRRNRRPHHALRR